MQSPFSLMHPLNPGATVQQEAQRAQRWVTGPQSTCLLQTLHTLVGQAHSGLQGLWGDPDTSGLQHSSTFLRAKRSVQERTSTWETVTSGALFAYKYVKTYWNFIQGNHTHAWHHIFFFLFKKQAVVYLPPGRQKYKLSILRFFPEKHRKAGLLDLEKMNQNLKTVIYIHP